MFYYELTWQFADRTSAKGFIRHDVGYKAGCAVIKNVTGKTYRYSCVRSTEHKIRFIYLNLNYVKQKFTKKISS